MTIGGQAYGCGQCLPCRIKKRREWTHRIMLEAGLCRDNCFLTLTYNDEANKDDQLRPEDLKDFWKRLRERIHPLRIRYYAVGEYGEKHGRPHYHAALFGYPHCKKGAQRDCACPSCKTISEAWGKGFIKLDPLEMGSARYVARYVIKKMTRRDDPRLTNREPEFGRMSNRPGIGHGVLQQLAAVIRHYKLLTPEGDVPHTLRWGAKEMPLGRYLRRKLRLELGLNEQMPQASQDKIDAEMFELRMAARADKENPSLRHHLLQKNQGAITALEARYKHFEKGKDTL